MSQLAASANQEKLPILLIVSQHHCPFCVRLKEEIIYPMQISGDYEDKVIIAEVLLDSSNNILDLKGNLVKPGVIGDSYKVWVTPTLLFLDHTGREIHKRMLGVNTIEMYSYYLDESLEAALRAVRKGDQSYIPMHEDILGDAPGFDQLY
ncbi:MAG: thioredoxin fold domain-containing protein [Candidatus Thiodiazotropha sp. (ex Lucinoma borealis)]|nr:thioredoxin fold domain-containing protein [Candidatus Thiodiazotropha sp. (ex Lucinoma borealis)]